MTACAIYEGHVTHTRIFPCRHSFDYRVFSLLLDLDELDRLDLHLFARNRAALLSFHDRDHGDGRPLRDWAMAKLAEAGIAADGPVRLLCYPRLWGFVFNPLSVWFCHNADGSLAATIYEVHNTFGERHSYVLRAGANQECDKTFFVSPFLSLDCRYSFRIVPPGEGVVIAIRESEGGAPVLNAVFSGRRKALTDRNLASAVLRHPLMTLKVIAAIHFEALRLWLKRVPTHAHLKVGASS
ncbi:MAG TPA: DUF1365 domain-containing protein [Rhizomicrobium sp.]|jgi:hypothetical protein